MKTTVVHHSADFDGIFCREIARKFLPDAEFIGWDFPDAPLGAVRLTTGAPIYVLDLPVDRVFAVTLSDQNKDLWKNVIWIDHHKSSIDSHPTDIPGYRIDGVAACRLAWQWFNERQNGNAGLPEKISFLDRVVREPLAVRLAGEYDVWDKRDPHTDVFQFGLRSRTLTDEDWQWLLTIADGNKLGEYELGMAHVAVAQLLSNGKLLQGYQQDTDAGTMERSFTVEFAGLRFLALNTARCNSLTFTARDNPNSWHDALMGFYWNGKKWNVSLYHSQHRKDLDLSQIAVKYGGGGHRGACGFQADKLPFLP